MTWTLVENLRGFQSDILAIVAELDAMNRLEKAFRPHIDG